MKLQQLPLSAIDRPTTPDRLSHDLASLNELSLSIKNEGLLQPIIVQPITNDRYEIIAGDRRYQAIKSLRWETIPAIIRHDLEGLGADSRLAENIHRTNLSPMEEALAVARLTNQSHITTTDIASRLHRSKTWVQQRAALLDIPPDLKELVHTHKIAVNTALHLARVDDATHRAHLLEYALRTGASANVMREWVNEWTTNRDTGNVGDAPTPMLPAAGESVIVLIPCYICHAPTPHTRMVIARLCTGCHAGINENNTPPIIA